MTDAEFRMVREYLGLDQDWVADQLGVAERTVRRWEAGTSPVPSGVRAQMTAWEAETARAVGLYVEELLDAPRPGVYVARTDADAPAAWPARWHRHVVARAARELPRLRVAYAPVTGEAVHSPVARGRTGRP